MSAGDLRHRVTLQTQVTTQDAIGQPSTAWLDTSYVWADVRHLSGIAAIKAGMDTSLVRVSVRIRHMAVSAAQRLVYGTEIYVIKSVLPDGQKRYIDLVCEAQSA